MQMTKVKELKTLKGTKFMDDFSKEIYEQTYEYNKETLDGTFDRVSKDLSSLEKDPTFWANQFNWLLEDFKFVPGGRILSNAGTGLKGTTYINCFVDGFTGEDRDSMDGIFDALKRQGKILKSEGGYGFCADTMRPRGSFIFGIGNESPGAVKMLDMWDTQSTVITAGSGRKTTKEKGKIKIRKGAQMVTMSVWHPDIEEFITSKQTAGRLTKFNMSVLITDEFMNAVENNLPWKLEFPDYESKPVEYKKEWDGNIKSWKDKGYPVTVNKEYSNANQLYDIIMQSTYTRNEPGVLFVDTMNRLNNLWYNEYISATNPCGEQILPTGGVCLLGSINLTQFVNFETKDFDYEKLSEALPIAVRMLDNVNDVTNVPLDVQRENLQNKRRIGLGIMGYGSALMMLQIRYGSDEAITITKKLQKFIMNESYRASALLAKEKGAFPAFNKEKYLAGNFVKNLDQDVLDLIDIYGIRNSHLLSHQPTGNTAIIVMSPVSGGQEPVFMPEYVRTSIFPYPPTGLNIPTTIDWSGKTFKCNDDTKWDWIKEGDEALLSTKFDGHTWKYDRSRGLLRETVVKDYAVRYLEEKGQWNPKATWAATTTELSIDEHMKTMTVFAKYIDSAMSKTVNLNNDYPFEDFKRLYSGLYKTGTVKGCTTYRAGTMTEVLASVSKQDETTESVDKIQKTTAPKRPKSLECEIHHVTAEGIKWMVIVGLLEGDPYEVFAFLPKSIHLPSKIKTGTLTKVKKGRYDLECEGIVIENLRDHFETSEQEALTRIISTALRHGTDVEFIVDQLQKSEGTIISFSKAIGRSLKKYITDTKLEKVCDVCSSKNIALQEGCYTCMDCGSSKCS